MTFAIPPISFVSKYSVTVKDTHICAVYMLLCYLVLWIRISVRTELTSVLQVLLNTISIDHYDTRSI